MAPTAEQEGKCYPTRFRERMAIQKKYDDIFSCVVEKALMGTSDRPTTPSQLKSKLRKRAWSESLPAKARIRFDSERITRESSSSEDSEQASSAELDDDDIIIIEEKLSYFQCPCGKYAQNHSKLHEHIVTEHPPSTLAHCLECGVLERVLRNNHLCRICNVFSEDLEEHLRIHYQDRTGCGALMECRTCYRTFPTVHEVRLHEQFSHGAQRCRAFSRYLCDYCGSEFTSKHLRDVHLISHFERVIGSVWDRIEQMQSEFTDQLLVNQCPICYSVMGSRKSFKLHIVKKHLTQDPESFMSTSTGPLLMELPVLLLTNGVLLPNAKLKVPVKSKTNLATLDRFIVNKGIPGKSLVLVAYRVEKEKKVFETGTVALVEQVVCWSYNNFVQYTIHLVGVSRAKIEKFAIPISTVQQLYAIEGEISAELRKEFLNRVRELSLSLSFDRIEDSFTLKKFLNEDRMEDLADYCVSLVNDVPYPSLLNYLATLEIPKRVKLANDWLKDHLKTISTIGSRDVRIEQPYLPRGVRQIPHKPAKNNIDELESKLQNAGLPDNVKDRVWAEFERLKGMGPNSSEQHVLTSYLELVASLPWNKSTPESIDIKKARELLDASHSGMEDVKKRVLEFLAVRKLSNSITGPILCFAGPPGIGKTSIAKAIAQSLGRNFERISLGGIRDESDIRGHRRTYVAAMCGRIIQAMKHAGSNNPLILLDEVDKLFSGLHGSPSAALLEVLDPEQNNSFTDHYLNLPFDLSNVLFIATANDLSKIEGPLADRMEIIEMTGYSTNEKIEIAERHLIPRQLLQHGICPDHLRIQTDALRVMVEDYTRESGVRQLERAIAATCRFVALRIAESVRDENEVDSMMNTELPIIVTAHKCREILGKERFSSLDLVEQMGKFRIGTCFGLAWTPFGGELMVIEANRCAGKGKTVMTGKLGDVLRESVDVARTWIRANAVRLSADNLEGSDIHVHLPSGAVGKDGPSAGCALVAALFSLASGRLVRADTAVTGEISLTGHILPVGGIKEKVLGAHRAGLRRVILPLANQTDVEHIDKAIKEEMDILFSSDIDDLLQKIMESDNTVNVLSKL